jgi:arylsulfatase A-like enzyme
LVTNGNLAPEFGLGQGFDTYVHLKERGVEVHRRAEELHAEAIGWLGERSKEQPFFLYVHATDPHAPYTPPAGFQKEFAPNLRYPEASSLQVITELFKGERQADDDLREDLVNLYDSEIAYWDHEFGIFLDHLDNAGLADNTIVVLVSDHGEEFAEHGKWQHSTSVHSELIQVPFVIRLPLEWGAGTKITTPVQHVDIFPTLLDLLGISGEEVKVQLDGRSLVPDITGAEVAVADVRSSLRTRSRIITDCVVGGRFKLIRQWSDSEPTSHLLFDRAHDPGELRDIARHNPITVEFFRRQFSSAAIDPGSLPRAEMESETRDALKALGYIE